MKNHIIFFSGGKSSFAVADYVKTNYPNDNIILYFTDTLWECDDLYRFIYEASDKLALPLLMQSRGITPPQLMVKQKFLANSRVGICSKELKMKVSSNFLKKGIVPEIQKWHNKQFLKNERFRDEATLYFGIGFMEMHRAYPIKANWENAQFKVEFPLIDYDIDNDKVLHKYGIKQPLQYRLNFTHNNCKGRCIKGGQAHFKNLLMKDEKTFQELKEQEIIISEYIRYMKQSQIKNGKCKDYMFKDVYEFVSTGKKSDKIINILEGHKHTKNWCFGVDKKGNDIKKPYTFLKSFSLEDLETQPIQIDMFDFGACGCFVDFEETGS